MSADDLTRELTTLATDKLDIFTQQINRCANLLSTDECWHRANPHTNSVANLILHLTGNVRQWIIGGLGNTAIERDRPAEFAARNPRPVAPLLTELASVVTHARQIITRSTPQELTQSYKIQGYQVAGLAAVVHVVEHFAFHTGQIVHITKSIKDLDLSLYDQHGHRLDHTNSP